MTAYNAVTEQIKQGGTRRGANMGILRVDHPDIMDFIACKNSPDALNNFNISIAVTKEFMDAVDKKAEYSLIDPHTKKETGRLKAQTVWDAIVRQAWKNGEPGLFFVDRANSMRSEASKRSGTIESTNPCGEQPLAPYESCNLGSLNVSRYYDTEKGFNYIELGKDVVTAVRFLDNVIDCNTYPDFLIRKATDDTRKIGLGIMGLADLFIKMGIPYESKEAFDVSKKIWQFIKDGALKASISLARTKGNCGKGITGYPRNLCQTTIAPTGTISIIAGCSSGIEPLFALSYIRNILDGAKLKELHPEYKKYLLSQGFSEKDIQDKNHVWQKGQEKQKAVFATAHEISPLWHVKMQALFQIYSDSAVSKTVNLPAEATEKDVAQIFMAAYKMDCKGITVYRDGCRANQPMSAAKAAADAPSKGPRAVHRPRTVKGETTKYTTHLGKLLVTVNHVGGTPIEVIAVIGKSGQDINAMTEALGRAISVSLKFGVPISEITKQLTGISGGGVAWDEGKKIVSVPDAIGQALSTAEGKMPDPAVDISKDICPECKGQNVNIAGNCASCPDCGWSKC
jgi:ribonucleoside-diphosphate reductase alpha chain